MSLRRICLGSLTLTNSLGAWKAAPNRIWRVLFNAEEGGILEVMSDKEGVVIYEPGNWGNFHRREVAEHRVPRGVPARVRRIDDETLKLTQIGRNFNERQPEGAENKPDFMQFLRAWGGEWMW